MRGVRINYIYLSSPLNFVDQRRDSMYFTMAKTNKQTKQRNTYLVTQIMLREINTQLLGKVK